MRERTFAIEGMHCAACGLLIDDTLLDLEGVVDSRTDLRSGTCRVRADDHVTDATLATAIESANYRVLPAGTPST